MSDTAATIILTGTALAPIVAANIWAYRALTADRRAARRAHRRWLDDVQAAADRSKLDDLDAERRAQTDRLWDMLHDLP